jgi:acetolactate synthase-1/2/3 large subunit
MAKMRGGQYIAEHLVGYGVSAIFFVPNMLSRALACMEDLPIKRVLVHSEQAAVYMADGYARASGKPGVCAAQAIGAANMAAGLRDPYLAHSPVIALTGGGLVGGQHRKPYQEISDYPVFEPLTKANFQVDRVERLPDLLRQAFREACSGTPGPVNLQIAGLRGDIEEHQADFDLIVEPEYTALPAHRPAPEAGRVAEAVRLLRSAKRPVIVAGGGTRQSQAGKELLEFAERLSIPVATALHSLALVPDNHPLFIGVPGSYSRSCANQIVSQSDLVFFIGSQTGGQVTHFWQVPPPGSTVIQAGIDAGDLGRNYPNAVSLLGDAKITLRAMLAQIPPGEKETHASWAAWAKDIVDEWRRDIAPLRDATSVPMRPERLFRELSDHLPDNALVVCDTGHIGMWAAQQLWVNHTNWDFIRAAGSLGWGFPASLGAKCAVPYRPVICVTGDGGFWYHLQEIETAVRCGIRTVTIVNNNCSLNQEIPTVRRVYEGTQPRRDGEMWRFSPVSLAKIAESFGAVGLRVERPQDLGPAMKVALECGAPAVIEVMTEVEALAPTAWTEANIAVVGH